MHHFIKTICLVLICGVAASAAAHRYFFSITDFKLNTNAQSLEVIHQITAHDFDNAIAENKQIHFSSAHPQYDEYAKSYLEAHFQAYDKDQQIVLNWVGLEINKGNIFIYQEAPFNGKFTDIKIKNTILIDNYKQQVNTVNFRDNTIKGSLTFTKSATINKIEQNK